MEEQQPSQLVPRPSVGDLFTDYMKNAVDSIPLPTDGPVVIADAGMRTSWPTKLKCADTIAQWIHQRLDKENCREKAEIVMYFSDDPEHDFQTFNLLSSQKKRSYFYATVPGSFYGRLFPRRSLHLFTSLNWVHLMGTIPATVTDKSSPAYNKGKVFYQTASPVVKAAFKEQYQKELKDFIEARAEELVPGGILYMVFAADTPGYWLDVFIDASEQTWHELVHEGVVSEEERDSFNTILCPRTVEEVEEVVQSDRVRSLFHVRQCEKYLPPSTLRDYMGTDDPLQAYLNHYKLSILGVHLMQHLGAKKTQAYFEKFKKVVTAGGDPVDLELGCAFVCTLIRL